MSRHNRYISKQSTIRATIATTARFVFQGAAHQFTPEQLRTMAKTAVGAPIEVDFSPMHKVGRVTSAHVTRDNVLRIEARVEAQAVESPQSWRLVVGWLPEDGSLVSVGLVKTWVDPNLPPAEVISEVEA
ncbi:MAG: hypothetical protein OEZ10_08790 [Gammaproteobacteria bacterium]|nr:hypothetical protein [Gammaproteobacteria bacterium]